MPDNDDPLASFFAQAPVLAQIADPDGRLIRISAAWARALGYEPAEMLGRDWVSFLTPKGHAIWNQIGPDLAQDAPLEAADLEFAQKVGSVVPALLSARVQVAPEGGSAQLVMILTDPSATRAAEAASNAKSRILAEISHELRSPINAMLGFAQVLKRSDLDARAQRHVAAILSAGRTVITLLTQFLDFSQIEAGGIDLDARPFDLIRLLKQSALWWRQSAEAKGLTLHLDLSSGLPAHVIGDPVRLQQILDNLVGNAVKFTASGSVTVRADLIRMSAGTARIRLTVSDTGPGLDPDRSASLFEPFVQGAGNPDRSQGWGLGLAISQKIARAMAGEIGVASRPGEGAIFFLELDLALPPGVLA